MPAARSVFDCRTRLAPVKLGADARRGDICGQVRPCGDAQGGRDHGRCDPRSGDHRRGGRSGGRDGARTRPGRHPPRRRRRAHVRSRDDRRHPGGREHPRDGKGPHRALRRGPGARSARGGLHRRVRGADAGRRDQPHRQVGLQGPVRLRRHESRRGAAANGRGGGDDPLQGRGRDRRHRRGRAPHAPDHRRNPKARDARPRRGRGRRQGDRRPARSRAGRRRAGAPAGRPVLRRRDRHAGRCSADDGARRRRRVRRPRAIVEATTHWQDPERVAQASRGLGTPMVSLESSKLESEQLLAQRGW
jgi:hypothetical protein